MKSLFRYFLFFIIFSLLGSFLYNNGLNFNFHKESIPTNSNSFSDTNKIQYMDCYDCNVIDVIDGDTVKVFCDCNNTFNVRLIGVDCPELSGTQNITYWNGIDDEEYLDKWAYNAKEFTTYNLLNKRVFLHYDNLNGYEDKYGRALAYIELNEMDYNLLLIQDGFARVYMDANYIRKLEYIQVGNVAIGKKVGLWNYFAN